ncbi:MULTISPECIES: LysR family transcriptional regulator [Mycolicibacterium]|uniref:Probable hydrogen peroxide-inducible genes activator n=3 Tax=Mycolicibacterium gilvum TaxID=1804 RepID=E6TAE7_MYCSR|nr:MULTISPECIES: LysR family transcriptional regulator [Mycolicibacterium]ABP46039.1 transcriptional regulator, LysR family [Mycolicibacterium gilvum PYR-GCK]ADT99528.1 transcriptional regulator, LysR family [Mycolicibacterium gilvum Spyr1]MBV5245891.1 LysR family transcriptional regulator [Mycolicibacterium sp. PAM1]MCV7057290.1 LysR family transcriptional regulator [Mycolicibacterium gilvum]STZ43530.1 LysR family transcriptional regulator [Mycolicibacterium gilvum]
MELRQLEYFVAIVEEGGFTRAASRERVAQPAVSAQIRRLERSVGQPLLTRTSREVRLTRAGEALLPHARAALAAVRDGRAAVDDVAGLLRGSVAIGTVTLHPMNVAHLIAEFHADHPDVEITLGTATSDVLIAELGDGRLDLAIVSIAVDEDLPGLEVAVITDEAVEAAVADGHPLAHRRSLSLEQLSRHPLISLPAGTGLRTRLDTACAAAGLRPRIAFEATSPAELAELARHGLGVAILPQSMARGGSGLHALRLAPELRGRLVWAWRADGANPAARVLGERARAMAVSPGSGAPAVVPGA